MAGLTTWRTVIKGRSDRSLRSTVHLLPRYCPSSSTPPEATNISRQRSSQHCSCVSAAAPSALHVLTPLVTEVMFFSGIRICWRKHFVGIPADSALTVLLRVLITVNLTFLLLPFIHCLSRARNLHMLPLCSLCSLYCESPVTRTLSQSTVLAYTMSQSVTKTKRKSAEQEKRLKKNCRSKTQQQREQQSMS